MTRSPGLLVLNMFAGEATMATTEDLEITALNAMAASPDGAMTLSDLTAHLETRLGSSDEESKSTQSPKATASGMTCGDCSRLNKGLVVCSTEGSRRWMIQATWFGSRPLVTISSGTDARSCRGRMLRQSTINPRSASKHSWASLRYFSHPRSLPRRADLARPAWACRVRPRRDHRLSLARSLSARASSGLLADGRLINRAA